MIFEENTQKIYLTFQNMVTYMLKEKRMFFISIRSCTVNDQ